MAESNEHEGTEGGAPGDQPGIFDLFEAPPPRDPNSFGKIPVIKESEIDLTDGQSVAEVKAAADAEAAGLQHWTAPATGQLPAVLSEREGQGKNGIWGDVAGPSWHGDDPEWSGPDLADVFADTDSIKLDEYVDDEDDEDEEDETYQPLMAPRSDRLSQGIPGARSVFAGRDQPNNEWASPRPADTDTPAAEEESQWPDRPAPPAPLPAAAEAPSTPDRTPPPPLAAGPERRQAPSSPPAPRARSILGGSTPSPATEQPAQAPPQSTPAPPQSTPAPPQSTPTPAPPQSTPAPPQPTVGPAPTTMRESIRLPKGLPNGKDGFPHEETWPDSEQPSGHGSLPVARPDQPASTDRHAPPAPEVSQPIRTDFDPPSERRPQSRAEQPPAPGRQLPSLDDIEFVEPEPRRIPRPGSGGPSPEVAPGLTRDDSPIHDDDSMGDDELDQLGAMEAPVRRGGRNLPLAIAVGAALVAGLLGAMWLGPEATLLLVVTLALVGVAELYNAMRTAGLRPATLLGIVGTVAAPAAAFYRGDAAMPLIIGLTVVFGTLWYLVGADTERPVLNLSLTMLGIFWVGGLSAFAGLMLQVEAGLQLLLATIIITVASDTMAYIGGRAYGSRPFHPASPNKTWEGTFTGFLAAVFAGLVIGITEMTTIWEGNLIPAIVLGAVVGILAPIGDLAESVVKRDLGIKDMGQLLPGHGGVLDRVDALLFALPGAYYLGLVTGIL